MAKKYKTNIDMDNNAIQNISAPVDENDACNKKWTSEYVTAQIQASLADITADISNIENEIDTLDTQLTAKIDTEVSNLDLSITNIQESISTINTNMTTINNNIQMLQNRTREIFIDMSTLDLPSGTDITATIDGETFMDMVDSINNIGFNLETTISTATLKEHIYVITKIAVDSENDCKLQLVYVDYNSADNIFEIKHCEFIYDKQNEKVYTGDSIPGSNSLEN